MDANHLLRLKLRTTEAERRRLPLLSGSFDRATEEISRLLEEAKAKAKPIRVNWTLHSLELQEITNTHIRTNL